MTDRSVEFQLRSYGQDLAEQELSSYNGPPPRRVAEGHSPARRAMLLALTVLLIVSLGAIALRTSNKPDSPAATDGITETGTPPSNPSAADDAPSEATRQQFGEWLSEYDPAEIQYLKDLDEQQNADSDVVTLVTTLEFRRACQTFASVLDGLISGRLDAGEAEAAMNEQLARLDERSLPGDQAADYFSQEFQQLQAGNLEGASAFLDSGSCSRAFDITPRP